MERLFAALADNLSEQLANPECPGSVAEVARKFLSDNGVNMDLNALIEQATEVGGRILPFSTPEVLTELEELDERLG